MDIKCINDKGIINYFPEHVANDQYMMDKIGQRKLESPVKLSFDSEIEVGENEISETENEIEQVEKTVKPKPKK